MNSTKGFIKTLKQRFAQKQNEIQRLAGVMGDGSGNLYASGLNGFVYVTIGDKTLPVFNNRVPAQYGVKVWVGYAPEEPTLFQVLSTRSENPSGANFSGLGYAPAKRYEWLAAGGGQDPLHVHLRAISFLKISMSTQGGMYYTLNQGFIYSGSDYIQIPSEDNDLTTHIPSTSGKAALVLITIDNTGTLVETKGSEVDIDALAPTDLPAIPTNTAWISGAIRVYNGQTAVRESRLNTDIVDLRFASWQAFATVFEPGSGSDLLSLNVNDAVNELEANKADVGHIHAATEIDANGVTVNTGTLASGDVNSLLESNDGDVLHVDEVTGVPGFDVEIDFQSVTDFDQLHIRMQYDGGAGHNVDIEIYNNDTASWETFESVTDQTIFTWVSIIIPDATDYINSGEVLVRLYHTSSGNVAHDLYLDHVQLLLSAGGGGAAWDGDITDIDETSSADIGEAIADDDQGIIYNTSGAAWVRFAWSRVWTYIESKFRGKTDATVTTSNVSAVENQTYNLTIAGLTANRDFVLPAPSAAGKEITVNILDGDDTYFIILIGDTGVTINGGSAATEFHRIQTKGRSATFRSTSTSNWQLVAGCEEVIAAQSPFTLVPYSSAGTNSALEFALPGPMTITKWSMDFYVVAPNDGTHNWTLILRNIPATTTFASHVTDVEAAWTLNIESSFTPQYVLLADKGLEFAVQKNNSPGNLYCYGTIVGRLC